MSKMIIDKAELLSPAGSWESLRAAIDAGCDAVYFGAGELNMRSKSSFNFTEADLPEIVRIAKESGVKTYLTVNSVVYDEDEPKVRTIVAGAAESGVDAIIASDISAINIAREAGMRVHASTQLNIANTAAVKFFAQFCDVLVLARELKLDQVAAICQAIEKERIKGPSGELVKIEIFAHGALCMAISGKCYLSLHEKDLSANRGECVQICRRKYIVKDKETDRELEIDNEFIMSPKDLRTIDFLDKILNAGVSVLKIEGRGRAPEYVKIVTRCYREAVESIKDGTYGDEKIQKWIEDLSKVYNRGFWDGYYLGKRLGEWSDRYGSHGTRQKTYVGKAINYYAKIGVAEFLVESGEISTNDEYLIIGRTTGVLEGVAGEIRDDKGPIETAVKGIVISIKVDEVVREGDRLYKYVKREQ